MSECNPFVCSRCGQKGLPIHLPTGLCLRCELNTAHARVAELEAERDEANENNEAATHARLIAMAERDQLAAVVERMRRPLHEAIGHVGAARMQLIDTDDQIIADHIRDADKELTRVFTALASAAGPADGGTGGESSDKWYPPHVTLDGGDIGLEWARGERHLTIFIGPDGVDIFPSPEPEQAFGIEDLEKAIAWCLADPSTD